MPRTLLERFMSADCETCWQRADAPEGAPLVLDWIVPGERGEDAPLAAAAIADAKPRAGAISEIRTRERWQSMAGSRQWGVTVEDGPAWNGYIAAQIHVTRSGEPGQEGSVAYVALVEQVRAGEEGTPIERMLVRSVAGPMPLDADSKSITHMRAFRIPAGSRPARLTAIGWVENEGGVMLAAARAMPDDCVPAR